MLRQWKTFIIGQPLASHQLHLEKLPKWKALAVFSSDALSSVAYATQEILIPLVALSVAATAWSLPVGLAITCLLIIVSSSYWQTIREYPMGGGAYIVARENLGTMPALVAGAALLIDYILTVAVSAAAGVEAITSAMPFLYDYRVGLCCLAIAIVTWVNLRGLRESSNVFAVPTYIFIVSLGLTLLWGLYQYLTGSLHPEHKVLGETYPEISMFIVLKAFSAGCAALTGIEAISDGVQAFKRPESKNARITLLWMIVILSVSFLGVTALSHMLEILPRQHETIISQLGRRVFGGGPLYYILQASTAGILLLAANTAFADFPRVCSFLANDRFMPRQLASLGDRLVFSKGIVLLGVLSACLVIVFGGTTHFLIPLYAVGVFLSFTISQSGMVRHHWVKRQRRWMVAMFFSALGALATCVVLLVIALSKFLDGAWLVIIILPVLVLWFRATREHYRKAGAQLALTEDAEIGAPIKNVVVLPVSGVHRGVIDAVKYAKSISSDVRVIYVELDTAGTDRMRSAWVKLKTGLDLVILKSPYRSITGPIVEYIRSVEQESDDDVVTVVIPEFVTARWWESIYHNQSAFMIRAALLFERGKVVTSVRYHLDR